MPLQALHIVGGSMNDTTPSPGIKLIEGAWPLDIDADGVMLPGSTKRRIVVDLSEMLSYRLGKQIPQTAVFRVTHLGISLRNVDDLNDNDGPNYFAGTWEWYPPTKHRVDAIQAVRKHVKVYNESSGADNNDQSAIWEDADSDDYKGFRFGFQNETDVDHWSQGSNLIECSLVEMFNTYNDGLANDGLPTKNRALWDRKLGRSSHLGWSAVCNNGEFIDGLVENDPIDHAFIRDFSWTAPSGHCIEVIGGLMVINVRHSSVETTQSFDDDFDLQIDIGVSGWSAF